MQFRTFYFSSEMHFGVPILPISAVVVYYRRANIFRNYYLFTCMAINVYTYEQTRFRALFAKQGLYNTLRQHSHV